MAEKMTLRTSQMTSQNDREARRRSGQVLPLMGGPDDLRPDLSPLAQFEPPTPTRIS
jgi:hypothetical protein